MGHAVLSIDPLVLPCTSSSECPTLPPTPGHLGVPPAGGLDCHYTLDFCCCGQCPDNFTSSCGAIDSTTRAGQWTSNLCPVQGCGSLGVVTSPNFPGNYPNNLERTEKIEVEQGLIVSLQFTAFDIEFDSACKLDHLKIKDGDGTILMEKTCGSTLPTTVNSKSNRLELYFESDGANTGSGWSVSWTAVTLVSATTTT